MRPPRPAIPELSRSGRVALALGVLALLGFAAETLRPGHHVHGGDDARHHHHFFVGPHTHDEAHEHEHEHEHEPEHEHEHDSSRPDGSDPPAAFLIDAFVFDEPASPIVLAVALRDFGAPSAVHPVDGPVSTERRVGGARAPPAASRA